MVSYLALAGWLVGCVAGCQESTASQLQVEDLSGGRQIRARWSYRSTAVDVDLIVTTRETTKDCITEAVLRTDEAIAGTERHTLEIPCDELRLAASGDLVLLERETGHDWSAEALDVHAGAQRMHLGPWWSEPPQSQRYRFTVLNRECGRCDCPELRGEFGQDSAVLPLGRFCTQPG